MLLIFGLLLILCILASGNSKSSQEAEYRRSHRCCAAQEEFLLFWENLLEIIKDPSHEHPVMDAEYAAAEQICRMGYQPFRVPDGAYPDKRTMEFYFRFPGHHASPFVRRDWTTTIYCDFYDLGWITGRKSFFYPNVLKELPNKDTIEDTRSDVLLYLVPPIKGLYLQMREFERKCGFKQQYCKTIFGIEDEEKWEQYCHKQDERFHNICVKFNQMKRERKEVIRQRKLRALEKAN